MGSFSIPPGIYSIPRGAQRIRKIDTNGIITTVAGNGQQVFAGDNGQATSASAFNPSELRFDAAGNLYIADSANGRIRKVAKSGIINTFAGGGGSLKDGVPATQTSLSSPTGLDFDSAGNLYILEQNGERVRMVAPDGTITTVAGAGVAGFSGDSGPATKAQFNAPIALRVDASGNVYVGDSNIDESGDSLRAVTSLRWRATGSTAFSPDGAQRNSFVLKNPTRVAIGPDGRVYITDFGDARIRRVEADGTLTTVVALANPLLHPARGLFPRPQRRSRLACSA